MTRRAHQCHHDGCDSEAQWGVTLKFLCEGLGVYRRQVTCEATIKVCGRHTDHAMRYVLSPRNRDAITHWLDLHGMPPADFASAEFEFDRVDHQAIDLELATIEQERATQ